jgi:uncharacterized small protein (DUF1192 family)
MSLTNDLQEWQSIDDIGVSDGKLVLPVNAPPKPGLYRLEIGEHLYFGEAGDINRRLGDYHSPGQGVEAELRIHKRILANGGARVFVMTGEDLSTRSQRCIRERQLILQARLDKMKLLNGGDIQEQIDFHESEITRLRAKLLKRSLQNNEAN